MRLRNIVVLICPELMFDLVISALYFTFFAGFHPIFHKLSILAT